MDDFNNFDDPIREAKYGGLKIKPIKEFPMNPKQIFAVNGYDWDTDEHFVAGIYYKKSNAEKLISNLQKEDYTISYVIKEIKIDDAKDL